MTDSQAKAIALKSRLMQLDRFIYGDKNVRTLLAGGWEEQRLLLSGSDHYMLRTNIRKWLTIRHLHKRNAA